MFSRFPKNSSTGFCISDYAETTLRVQTHTTLLFFFVPWGKSLCNPFYKNGVRACQGQVSFSTDLFFSTSRSGLAVCQASVLVRVYIQTWNFTVDILFSGRGGHIKVILPISCFGNFKLLN
ncbi:Uncharacterized protein APZ42_024590 [Daphnia magna]|uniref:Uncharacterized protein n=1 Tax=Daphnia magna TaxID=35525 RepID=A0A164U020_9CRUS|nr:Uncharacterized protein APZ42_024590 [Daphnia magna]